MTLGIGVGGNLDTKTKMFHQPQTEKSKGSTHIVWLQKYLPFVVSVCIDYPATLDFLLTILVGSFLPVTLEQLARERGVFWSDRSTSCMAKTATDAAKSKASNLLVRAAASDNNQCIVNVLGWEITTSSYAMYTFSLAVLIQALALVSFSSVADHGMSFPILSCPLLRRS